MQERNAVSGFSRFVAMAAPDAAEMATREFMSETGPDSGQTGLPKSRKRRASFAAGLVSKQENPLNAINPKPDEIQAGLDQALAKFVNTQSTSERRAAALIKLGSYQVELSKLQPILRDADEETALETLVDWFDQGDAELKKALVNANTGTEDFSLAKAAPVMEGPEYDLARMAEAVPEGTQRVAMLQKMSIYGSQVSDIFERGTLMKIDPASIDAAVDDWVNEGDGSHQALKKAVADVERMARAQANANLGENDLSDEMAGNGPTHAASKLSGQNDRTYGRRPTGEGAGARMRGSKPAPNQEDGDSPNVSSGPNDTGGGEVRPSVTVRRKGTTGGLGSVAGEKRGDQASVSENVDTQNNKDDLDPKKGAKKGARAKDSGKSALKMEGMALELYKRAPQKMRDALAEMNVDDAVNTMLVAAHDAADLTAWSDQTDAGNTLQKSALDAAVADWLGEDPERISLKKFTAEALGSAGEIPLNLARAIMAWQPASQPRVRSLVGA